ncbi:MAG: hypothetical protein DMG77_16045 [Acidobacteria bacterium]|nr:MAG: hypothetical protein DMG77_16045 [Acidobacteriota bacterium]
METIYQDLRYGWRMLRESPGFALVIVLMLALGIGANTAVFTVLSAALLRPLPFEKPEELAQVWETRTSGAFQQMESSYPDFVDMRNSQVFAQLGGYSRTTMTLSLPSGAVQVTVAMASTGFFETLGVRPVLGRTFVPSEETEQKTASVLLSYGGWQRRFGADPAAVGKTLTLDGVPSTIVGVGNENVGWLDRSPGPVIYDSFDQDPPSYFSPVVRTQQDPATLASAVTHAVREIDSEVPVYGIASMAQIISESPAILLRSYPAYLLGAFSGLALLLAVLGLYALLAYSVAQRTRELGLRMALGAQQKDVLRLILNNGVKLALIGGALGIAGAVAAGRVIASLLFGIAPTDTTTFAGVCLVLMISVLTASYVPAYRATKVDPIVALRYE